MTTGVALGEAIQARREEIEGKLFRADEAYVEARIAQDRYERMTGAYRTELAAVETRLHRAWAVLPLDGRHLLVGSIWPEGVLYDGRGYRTGPVTVGEAGVTVQFNQMDITDIRSDADFFERMLRGGVYRPEEVRALLEAVVA